MYYCGGLALTECQVLTKAAPSTTGQRRRNISEGLWVRDRERSLTSYHHRYNRLHLGMLIEIIAKQSQSRIMRGKTNLSYTPSPSFLALPPTPQQCKETRNGVCSHLITHSSCCCCSGRVLSLLQCGVPPTGHSSPWTSPKWVLPIGCSSSWTAPRWVTVFGM